MRPRRFGESVGSMVVLPLFIRGLLFNLLLYLFYSFHLSVPSGAILVPVPANIGPSELYRRILASKPACFVAGGGVIENDLLDVIDQVTI